MRMISCDAATEEVPNYLKSQRCAWIATAESACQQGDDMLTPGRKKARHGNQNPGKTRPIRHQLLWRTGDDNPFGAGLSTALAHDLQKSLHPPPVGFMRIILPPSALKKSLFLS
jgi:hypothetical protein